MNWTDYRLPQTVKPARPRRDWWRLGLWRVIAKGGG